jgi:hypothetical protein
MSALFSDNIHALIISPGTAFVPGGVIVKHVNEVFFIHFLLFYNGLCHKSQIVKSQKGNLLTVCVSVLLVFLEPMVFTCQGLEHGNLRTLTGQSSNRPRLKTCQN